MSERLDVTVTYDASCGYIASAPELRQPIVALSLGGLTSPTIRSEMPATMGSRGLDPAQNLAPQFSISVAR